MTRNEYETKIKELIEEIEHAFDGVEREDGVTLHEADVIDDYGDAQLRAEARLKDVETRWQDVPDEELCSHDSNLSFLDAKGFHYYFPAYLVWSLRFMGCEEEEDGFWSNTFSSIDYKLLAYKGSNIDDLFLENFSLFTPSQKRVIAHYLQFQLERLIFIMNEEGLDSMRHEEPKNIQRAIDVYWGRFL